VLAEPKWWDRWRGRSLRAKHRPLQGPALQAKEHHDLTLVNVEHITVRPIEMVFMMIGNGG
jgi:hypothetical protein